MYDEFMLAVKMNQPLLVKELIKDYNINIHTYSNEALRWVSFHGRVEMARLLLDSGANVQAPYNDALRYASLNGHAEIIKLLIDNGADIHANCNEALRCASINGHVDIVKTLLDNGADVNDVIKNYSYDTESIAVIMNVLISNKKEPII